MARKKKSKKERKRLGTQGGTQVIVVIWVMVFSSVSISIPTIFKETYTRTKPDFYNLFPFCFPTSFFNFWSRQRSKMQPDYSDNDKSVSNSHSNEVITTMRLFLVFSIPSFAARNFWINTAKDSRHSRYWSRWWIPQITGRDWNFDAIVEKWAGGWW